MNNISVVLPVYNCAKYLEEALLSLVSQDINNLEIICVYQNSSDNSHDILIDYANKYSNLKIIYLSKPNLVNALNLGILNSSGEYIARMDADDISLPGRLSKQFNFLKFNCLDICGSHYFLIDSDLSFIGARLVPIDNDQFLIALACGVPFAHGSVMFRKSFLLENNLLYSGVHKANAEDYRLWTEMFKKNAKFGNINDWLFSYRVHETSVTNLHASLVRSDRIRISKEFISTYGPEIIEVLKNMNSKRSISFDPNDIAFLIIYFFFKGEVLIFRKLSFIKLKNIFVGFIRNLAYLKVTLIR